MTTSIGRRRFLAGAGAAALLAACGDDGKGAATTTTSTAANPPYTLIGFYASDALIPGIPQRLPFGLAGSDGAPLDKAPVDALSVSVSLDGVPIGPSTTVKAHSQGLPRAYYPVTFTPTKAGVYTITSTVDGTQVEATVQIGAASAVPAAGSKMVPFDTPTVADPKGVELLCTHEPPCPLHEVTLAAALAEQRPVAFLIATPKFCQVAICGPVLDVLLGAVAEFPGVRMLHSEVYPTEAKAQPGHLEVVPVVQAYRLTYEPVLFLAKADGTIAHRLDTIFDGVELREALSSLTA